MNTRYGRFVWLTVLLVGVYIMLQLVADVAAAKITSVWGLTMPAGTFVYAVTFTWRDMLHKRLGRDWARAAIVTAALCNLLMVAYFQFAIQLPSAVFWGGQEAFQGTLGVVWRIAIASIAAEVISELTDTEVYHILTRYFSGPKQALRVLGSNTISLPLDSIVFATLAFAGTMPLSGLISIAKGQIVFKFLVTLVSLPAIYVIPERKVSERPVSVLAMGD